MELARSCCWPKQHPLLLMLHSIFQSLIGLWVKIWLRNKTACSELNPVTIPVQSCRSKSMTCKRKGSLLTLLRFAQWLQMAASKRWEYMSGMPGMTLNQSQPKFTTQGRCIGACQSKLPKLCYSAAPSARPLILQSKPLTVFWNSQQEWLLRFMLIEKLEGTRV